MGGSHGDPARGSISRWQIVANPFSILIGLALAKGYVIPTICSVSSVAQPMWPPAFLC
jgi:hypothetical protein